jgi:hypothetical protein
LGHEIAALNCKNCWRPGGDSNPRSFVPDGVTMSRHDAKQRFWMQDFYGRYGIPMIGHAWSLYNVQDSPGLPDFPWYYISKREKNYPKYHKLGIHTYLKAKNIQNFSTPRSYKIYLKLVFCVWKFTTWQLRDILKRCRIVRYFARLCRRKQNKNVLAVYCRVLLKNCWIFEMMFSIKIDQFVSKNYKICTKIKQIKVESFFILLKGANF